MDDDLIDACSDLIECDGDVPHLGPLRWWHVLFFFWVLS